MALRLQIISDQSRTLGGQATVVFGPRGGRIGRAPDNDWVLPDPKRYLSAHHATIHAAGADYELEDTSRNGVYTNDSDHPVGRDVRQALADGDILRLGDYRIRVHIDPIEVHDGLSDALVAVERVEPVRRGLDASPAELHAAIGDLKAGEQELSASENSSSSLFATLENRSGLMAFCRGAGIEVNQLQPNSDLRILLLAGQLLRESLMGLQQLARAQRDFQKQLGTTVPVSLVTGPAPDTDSPADYLVKLLNGEVNGELEAVQVLRAFFGASQRHEAALPATFRVALLAFLNHLDPAVIEERAKAKCEPDQVWALYTELFRNIRQTARGDLPRLYSEALVQAYGKP